MSQHQPSSVRLQDAFLRLGGNQREPVTENAQVARCVPDLGIDNEKSSHVSDSQFRPGFEVDQFAPSPLIDQLLETVSPVLANCLRQIRQKVPKGARVVGFISPEPGHGCTTTTILLAYGLSKEKTSTLVIDASPDRQLADSLGLDIETGWEQSLIRRHPLHEVIIRSNQDHFDVLPGQGGALVSKINGIKPADWPEILAAYEWILIDFGHAFMRASCSANCGDSPAVERDGSTAAVHTAVSTVSPFLPFCPSFVIVQRYDSESVRLTLPAGAGEILGVIETFVHPNAGEQVLVNPREAA